MMGVGKSIFLILAVALALAGCATKESLQPTASVASEYRKMLALQKKKADAIDRETAQKKIPEMTAEDHDRLGDASVRRGDANHAYLEYQKALAMKPGLVLTRYKTGQLFLEKGLADEAMEQFDILEKQDPRNALAHLGKGMVCFRKGNLKPARSEFENALSLDERLWEAHVFLGLMCDRDDVKAAALHYEKAIELNPRSAPLYNNLGMSFYLSGDYELAAAAYGKALAIDPSISRVYNNLGLALSKMGRYKEAFEMFSRGKDEAGAYNNMGYLYLTEQKYGEAKQALEKAIELKPSFYAKAYENMDLTASGARTGFSSPSPGASSPPSGRFGAVSEGD